MNLIELVSYFRKGNNLGSFTDKMKLDEESEVIFAFSKRPYKIEDSLLFFEFEKTEGKGIYNYDNEDCYCLFDFYYFLDVIEEASNISDIELANVIFNYIKNDA